ncbi:SDR family oxidoreductase [Myceligenerans pegani]|uniref:SDR family oxidoreductase n=1 Tax=Myceligenerans pegani TaxID=2776917 RepID=A0ABR9MVL9_9MICO|nr:SDR family oxidoreductase [Myceligenerans sp. TRM 65318]MBE1875428.1 SDR family oxidoreductase [Myceligenerans sp. TRM 65318]MBE3017699.1 SDR family oxidoreductase [Myceligenerans sp. TRM 65318]
MALTPNLSGRVAVVTGASSGMGEATARLLAAHGAAVALLARRAGRLEHLAVDIRAAGGTAVAIPVDVTDSDAVKAAAARVQDELGDASIVFNNAGIMLPNPILDHREDEWATQIDVNVRGAVATIGAFVDQLVETATAGKPADLINTSSIAAQNLFPEFAVYSASKAFVAHLSRHLRMELGAKGVRVSDVAPGGVDTELIDHVTHDGVRAHMAASNEARTVLTGQDIAEVVAFLVALPARVNLQEVVVMPTTQAG